MTWHWFGSEEVNCAACTESFIPFEPEFECPKCGTTSTKRTEFLQEVVNGLQIHKSEYGTFTSGAYFVGSAAENLFLWICRILDAAEEHGRDGEIEPAIQIQVDSMDWGDHIHMKRYLQKLALCAWRQLQRDSST